MVAAEPATLAGIRGRGYLALRTEGYPRIEGVFFAPQPSGRELFDLYLSTRPVQYEGAVYRGSQRSLETCDVWLRAIKREAGRIRLDVTRAGSAESPPPEE